MNVDQSGAKSTADESVRLHVCFVDIPLISESHFRASMQNKMEE